MQYTETVLDHFINPRNMGEVENPNGVGEVGSAACGDIMRITMQIADGVIQEVAFKTFGCGAAVATSSVATEMIKGKKVDDALKLTNKEVVDELGGLPLVKIHCSVLAEQAIKTAIADYYKRQGIDPEPIVGAIPDAEDHH